MPVVCNGHSNIENVLPLFYIDKEGGGISFTCSMGKGEFVKEGVNIFKSLTKLS